MSAPAIAKECRNCLHFRNDAAFLEDLFKGLTTLSSADASVRADDGICLLHQRFLSARSSCAHFSAGATAVKVA